MGIDSPITSHLLDFIELFRVPRFAGRVGKGDFPHFHRIFRMVICTASPDRGFHANLAAFEPEAVQLAKMYTTTIRD
jgi:hypothetical protein